MEKIEIQRENGSGRETFERVKSVKERQRERETAIEKGH